MDKIKNYTIIALFAIIGVLLLLKQCGNTKVIEKPIIKESEVIKYHIDTVKIHDTIIHKDILFSYRNIHDTIFISKLKGDTLLFSRRFEDSCLILNAKVRFEGKLIDGKFDYKLKVPREIIVHRDSTITLLPEPLKQPKIALYVGGVVGGNANRFNFGPYLGLSYKNANYMYQYDMINKTHNIGVGIKINIQ